MVRAPAGMKALEVGTVVGFGRDLTKQAGRAGGDRRRHQGQPPEWPEPLAERKLPFTEVEAQMSWALARALVAACSI